jgi:UDP-N-acetylmuramyl pentapeptide phosphotransferase/UDP-N-acetylglucosamine-1-phosphate transferase
MAERIVVAFVVAALVVLALGAGLRAASRRREAPWLRRWGGATLFAVVPVGLLAAGSIPVRALTVAGGALVLGGLGLLRTHRPVPTPVVGVVVVGVAIGVAATGSSFPLGGVPAVDFVWTVAWLAGVTAALATTGTAAGQFPTLAAASTLGVLGLAGFAGQSAAATLSAALLGGLLAFLAYNWHPASLFVGVGGTWCCAFLVAAGAIWARPSIGRPGSFLVHFLIVAVALLDAAVVVVSRLRRRRPLTRRVQDHLSHRLVALGLPPAATILTVAGVQTVVSVVAVLTGRGVLALGVAAGVAGALLLALWGVAMRARMRDPEGVPGLSGRVRALVAAVVVVVVAATSVAAVSAAAARRDLLDARNAAEAAIVAARGGDSARAVELFGTAETKFRAADTRLGSPLNLPSLAVPVVGSNVHAARRMTEVGIDLSQAGRRLAEQVNADDLRFVDGRVPLETVARIAPELDAAAGVMAASAGAIDALDRTFLVGPLDQGVRDLRAELSGAARDATRAATVARVAPAVLGQDRPRRYLLVVQNPAEQRATGGLVGNWGILTAADGDVSLESIERTSSINSRSGPEKVLDAPADYENRYARFDPMRKFQNVNMTPDFPTAAAVMADSFEQSGFPTVDGVIAVDPLGLAALLELTGPLRIPGSTTPITATNVVDVTLRDAYANYVDNDDRVDFLGVVARAAVAKATTGDLGSIDRLSKVLGTAAAQGHLAVWFRDPAEQAGIAPVEVSGRVPAVTGDSLLVTNSNASANKLDYYTTKAIDYDVTVAPDPDLRRAVVSGTARVRYDNGAPLSGLGQYVAGPWEGNPTAFVYGQNKQFVTVYSPLAYTGARRDEAPIGLEVAPELDRTAYSTFLDVFAQRSAALDVDLGGSVPLRRGGWYDLDLLRQPALRPDTVRVRITVPAGYRIVDTRGLRVVDGVARGTFDLVEGVRTGVRIAPDPGSGLWARLRAGR